jgi:gliding motility-associated-like protein
MKKILILVSFLIIVLSTVAQVPDYVPTSNLVGYWPFNGNSNDQSGDGNNATNNGATLTTDRFGNANKAYYFNGTSSNIYVDNFNKILGNSPFTVNFWVEPLASSGWLVCFGQSSNGKAFTSGTHTAGSGNFDAGIWKYDYTAAYTTSLSLGTFQNMTITYDGRTMKVYKDATLSSTEDFINTDILNGVLTFGKQIDFAEFFKGKLDDIGIWSRVLTQIEIDNLYNACSTIPTVSSTTAAARCDAGTVSLSAIPSEGTINWYSAATGGTTLQSGNNFTTPSITTTTTYYVDAVNSGCTTGSRTAVVATVNTTPTINITPSSRCEPGIVTLGANPSVGTVSWYTALTGGSATQTGTSYTTPSINSTTTYYVDATNNGCTTTSRLAVIATVNTTPTVASTSSNARCEAGTVILGATPSAGSINWYSAATGGATLQSGNSYTTPSIFSTRTYYVDAVDNGCTTGTRTAVVATVNPNPTVVIVTPAAVCSPNTINLTATSVTAGSTSSLTYSYWTNIGATSSLSTPSAVSTSNTYYIKGVTTAGCSVVQPISISVNSRPTVNITSPNITICNNDIVSVSMSVTAFGTWTITVNDGIVTGSGSGIKTFIRTPNTNSVYSIVNAVDENCTSISSDLTGSISVTVNPIPSVAVVTPQVKCNGVSLDPVIFSGTVTGTTYAWTNSQSSIGIGANGSGNISSVALTNTTSSPIVGIFTVTPTANSCSGPAGTFTITVNPTPIVNLVAQQIKCNGVVSDPVVFSGTVAGTSYAWTNSQSSIGIASSGTGDISSLSLTNTSSSPLIGIISVIPTANSCAGAAGTFTITVNPTPTVNAITPQVLCNGVGLDPVIFSGTVTGTNYSWTNSQPSIGIGANGSGNISSVALTNTTSSPILGIFSVTPSANSCSGPAGTFTITVNPSPLPPRAIPATVCYDGLVHKANATVGVDETLTWYTASTGGITTSEPSGIIANTYTSYALAQNNTTNCLSKTRTSVALIINSLPTVSATISPISGAVCIGSNVTFTGIGASTYTYTGGVTNATPFAPSTTTTYTVSGTDANGCVNTYTKTIIVNPLPTVSATVSPISGEVCLGSNATLTGVGATNYSWSDGVTNASSFTPTITTTYTVTGTDANGCVNTNTKTIIVNLLPMAPIVSDREFCINETDIALTATSLVNHNLGWYGTNATGGIVASTAPTPLTNIVGTSTYYVSQTNTTNSCESPRAAINIKVKALPPTPVITSNSPLCEGTALVLNTTNIAGAEYYWEGVNGFTSTNSSLIINNVTSEFAINLKIKSNGCWSLVSSPVVVKVNPSPAPPAVSSNSPIEEEKTLNLTATILDGATYSWTGPNSFTSIMQNPSILAAKPSNSGNYYATVTLNGCTSSSSLPVSVVVNPKIIISPSFQMPNAFTPNFDGHNDAFKIIQNGYISSITSLKFSIYTKSGKLVFYTDKVDGGWDGRYAGIMLESDVYYWVVDVINKSNNKERYQGPVLLLK